MYKGFILKVFITYLIILGLTMLLRTDVFLVQFKTLSQQPALIFSLGFFGLIIGLVLFLANQLSSFGRFLGLLITLKSMFCLAFPFEFCQWMLAVASPKFIEGFGIFYLILAVNLWLYKRYFERVKQGE